MNELLDQPKVKAKKTKESYIVRLHRSGKTDIDFTGTLEDLITNTFGYTLECGASYQHEKGNKKINRNPRSIDQLIKNLNNAVNNSAANGYSGKTYSLIVTVSPEYKIV